MAENQQDLYTQPEQLISCFLDIGELLLTSGAEVLRVEDTIARLCKAYGFARADVFTITSSIVLTVHSTDGSTFTQTRRILSQNIDLEHVAQVNALSRALCADPQPIEKIRQEILRIRSKQGCPPPVQCLAYAIISAVFAVFFGGTFLDAVAALISGTVIYLSLTFCKKMRLNSILQHMLVSALAAFVIVLLVRAGIGNDPSHIMIGNIMLLIPGIAFTSSLRDLINGDTISGLLGFCEAVIKAMAIAIGSAVVLMQMGG